MTAVIISLLIVTNPGGATPHNNPIDADHEDEGNTIDNTNKNMEIDVTTNGNHFIGIKIRKYHLIHFIDLKSEPKHVAAYFNSAQTGHLE